ncbi:hypothetical protein P43SY_000172 [Pythium insidiosum]|uniref:TLC domain-containing protein n=1 Tax=Pythium insidiosum TaxID=114742 RepID=A0AAD5LDW9_PYTIN|nr:hypothetical protein P43SY_000172 [Pythium insidiosum]
MDAAREAWDDPRFQRLAACTAAWMVVWTTVLVAVPAGESGRNHIVSLNAAHGVVCTLVAAATIVFGWDTANSVAISLGYFLVDLVAMVKSDGIRRLVSLNRSRLMDYVHHFLGIFWGTIFYAHEATVCEPALGNPYVWIQTNEVSTPFYNWFRLTNSAIAGALFISLFFLSRIVFNTFYVIPRLLNECDTRYLWGCLPFFALQYVWFVMIVKKLQRTLRSKPEGKQQ